MISVSALLYISWCRWVLVDSIRALEIPKLVLILESYRTLWELINMTSFFSPITIQQVQSPMFHQKCCMTFSSRSYNNGDLLWMSRRSFGPRKLRMAWNSSKDYFFFLTRVEQSEMGFRKKKLANIHIGLCIEIVITFRGVKDQQMIV